MSACPISKQYFCSVCKKDSFPLFLQLNVTFAVTGYWCLIRVRDNCCGVLPKKLSKVNNFICQTCLVEAQAVTVQTSANDPSRNATEIFAVQSSQHIMNADSATVRSSQGSSNCILEKRQPWCESQFIRTPTTSLKTQEVLTDGKTLKPPMTAAKRKQKSRLLKQLLANGINEVDASNMLSGDDSEIHSLPTQLQATLRNWLPNVNTGNCVPHSRRYREDPEHHEKH